MVRALIADLYSEPAAHRETLHPVTGRTVQLMGANQVVHTAMHMLNAIERSGIARVVVLESGAAPLAGVCRILAERRGTELFWHYLKVDREYPHSYYLSQTLPEKEPYLLFDEYIDSGLTVKQAMTCLQSLGLVAPAGVICYYMSRNTIPDSLQKYAVVNGNEVYYWERLGAYPYENRVDLIGYFYCSGAAHSGRHYLLDYLQLVPDEDANELNNFLLHFTNSPLAECLLRELRGNCSRSDVRQLLNLSHSIRTALVCMEAKVCHDIPAINLLHQLADTYGPMWSPYPDHLHLDFIRTTCTAEKKAPSLPGFSTLLHWYSKIRKSLLLAAAAVCEQRRHSHEQIILNAIEEEM